MVVVFDGPALATAVKAQMKVLELKHAQAAELAGISPSTLSEVKSGSSKQIFRRDTLDPLERALQFPKGHLRGIYRKVMPRDSVFGERSTIESAMPEDLAVINARLDRIESHLRLDPMHERRTDIVSEIDGFESPGEQAAGE
jgi:hypothetical protein